MSEAAVLALINLHIVANGNNEITADVLRPILEAILEQPNDKVGELGDLDTADKTTIVNAINELVSASGGGFVIHSGSADPNVTPPGSFGIGDWYVRSGTSIYQYNGTTWVLLQSVGTISTDADNSLSLGTDEKPYFKERTAAEIATAYESNSNTNKYTDSEKSKLAGLEPSKFKGTYVDLSALNTAYPTADPGSYAYVDAGVGEDVKSYIWDDDDEDWIEQGSAPKFRGFQVTNDTSNVSLTSSTFTKATQLNTVDFNADGWYDEANKWFKPNVAGVYKVGGLLTLENVPGNSKIVVGIYKNGSLHKLLGRGTVASASTETSGFGGSVFVEMNGTTDYLEIYGWVNAASVSFAKTLGYSYFYANLL